MTWVPTACTLPATEQPLRVAEFDALFSDTLTSASILAPTRVQLVLDDGEATEERARDWPRGRPTAARSSPSASTATARAGS